MLDRYNNLSRESKREYTGKTIRLETYNEPELYEEIKNNPALEYRQHGDVWIVYQTTPHTSPPQAIDSGIERYDTESGILIPERAYNPAQPNTERHTNTRATRPLNDVLMPLILICILVMLIAATGDYHSIRDIPAAILLPVLFVGVLAYVSYRGSHYYEDNGKRLESFMRATHTADGKIKKDIIRRLVKGE